MSPRRRKNTGAKGCTTNMGKKQTSIFNYMSTNTESMSCVSPNKPKTPQKLENDQKYKN